MQIEPELVKLTSEKFHLASLFNTTNDARVDHIASFVVWPKECRTLIDKLTRKLAEKRSWCYSLMWIGSRLNFHLLRSCLLPVSVQDQSSKPIKVTTNLNILRQKNLARFDSTESTCRNDLLDTKCIYRKNLVFFQLFQILGPTFFSFPGSTKKQGPWSLSESSRSCVNC